MHLSISIKFVPKDPINNIPALVQIMAWRQAITWSCLEIYCRFMILNYLINANIVDFFILNYLIIAISYFYFIVVVDFIAIQIEN